MSVGCGWCPLGERRNGKTFPYRPAQNGTHRGFLTWLMYRFQTKWSACFPPLEALLLETFFVCSYVYARNCRQLLYSCFCKATINVNSYETTTQPICHISLLAIGLVFYFVHVLPYVWHCKCTQSAATVGLFFFCGFDQV